MSYQRRKYLSRYDLGFLIISMGYFFTRRVGSSLRRHPKPLAMTVGAVCKLLIINEMPAELAGISVPDIAG